MAMRTDVLDAINDLLNERAPGRVGEDSFDNGWQDGLEELAHQLGFSYDRTKREWADGAR
jgi:hypothetical protein